MLLRSHRSGARHRLCVCWGEQQEQQEQQDDRSRMMSVPAPVQGTLCVEPPGKSVFCCTLVHWPPSTSTDMSATPRPDTRFHLRNEQQGITSGIHSGDPYKRSFDSYRKSRKGSRRSPRRDRYPSSPAGGGLTRVSPCCGHDSREGGGRAAGRYPSSPASASTWRSSASQRPPSPS